jgi:hypothetical protein
MLSTQAISSSDAARTKVSHDVWILVIIATDRLGRTTITTLFPFLTQATSLTPNDQPCYVSFASHAAEKNRACLLVVNTPDTNTGTLTTEVDVRTACGQCQLLGLVEVTGCNNNVVTATFKTYNQAKRVRSSGGITLPSTRPSTAESVTVQAGFHLSWAPKLFICDVSSLEIDHDTVSECVMRALRGRKALNTRIESSARCELLLQETPDPHDERMRYILRFGVDARAPRVQQFNIPLDNENRDGKIWGIFKPENTQGECSFCGAICQLGRSSTCHYTRVIGRQGC